MQAVILLIAALFWLMILYYGVLTILGVLQRRKKPIVGDPLKRWPSVAVLIPAHNEAKVISATLEAMVHLRYPGRLEIYLLNDNSSDTTGEIASAFAHAFRWLHNIAVPRGTPTGKARVLNYGLMISDTEYVAVYDADNVPEPEALRLLVETAEHTPGAVGAVGYVKTVNEKKNWLTRMIALEFSLFQLVMQLGRWKLVQLGSLTGTNMIVRRDALNKVGAWDPYALAEDAELTMKLTAAGGILPVVLQSRTWEQEPESFKVWFRQRTRWMQGNLYLAHKMLSTPEWRKGRTLWHSLQLVSVYAGFVALLLCSDVFCVGGLLGQVHVAVSLPLLALWVQSIVIYMVEIITAQTLDGLLDAENMALAVIMYVTYAQLWVVIFFVALYRQVAQEKRGMVPVWDKTVRF